MAPHHAALASCSERQLLQQANRHQLLSQNQLNMARGKEQNKSRSLAHGSPGRKSKRVKHKAAETIARTLSGRMFPKVSMQRKASEGPCRERELTMSLPRR